MALRGRKHEERTHKLSGVSYTIKIETSGQGRFFADVEGKEYVDPTYEGLIRQIEAVLADVSGVAWTPAMLVNTSASEGYSSHEGPHISEKAYLGLGLQRFWLRPRLRGGIMCAAWETYDPASGRDERGQKAFPLDERHWNLPIGKPLQLPHSGDYTHWQTDAIGYSGYIWLPYDEPLFGALLELRDKLGAIRTAIEGGLRERNGRGVFDQVLKVLIGKQTWVPLTLTALDRADAAAPIPAEALAHGHD